MWLTKAQRRASEAAIRLERYVHEDKQDGPKALSADATPDAAALVEEPSLADLLVEVKSTWDACTRADYSLGRRN